MNNKRRFKRIPLEIELTISKLFKQDNEQIPDINTIVEVNNISKSGLGFKCSQELPLNYYFDAKILLSPNNYFNSVLKIIRIQKEAEDKYYIGCQFVGLADMLSDKIYLNVEPKTETLISQS